MTFPNAWKSEWRYFVRRLTTRCAAGDCLRFRGRCPGLRVPPRGIRLRGSWYCGTECLQSAMAAILDRESQVIQSVGTAHRIPLGLVLLSRQQITGEQLRTALELQRSTGSGKIGEWLQHLGSVTERQVTGALARQWSCPVLKIKSPESGLPELQPSFTAIPAPLLEASQMIPAEFAEASGTLLMAFSDGVDHTALYAIEQMLGYRTEACFVCPSVLRRGLLALARSRRPTDVVFDRIEDASEGARIVGSYSSKVGAEEVRLTRCGRHIWIRLERPRRETLNLVFRSPFGHRSDSQTAAR